MRQRVFLSYEAYRDAQLKTHALKSRDVWVLESELEMVAREVLARGVGPSPHGLCHGVRTGYEVDFLSARLGFPVVGTDLGPTDHSSVLTWDFHEVRPEWVGAMAFVYSNSLDHAYDPALAVRRWLSCLAPRGRCFIHWSNAHNRPGYGKNSADCFQGSLETYQALASAEGVLEATVQTQGSRYLLVVRA